jgi:hypothetical protein
MKTTDLPLKLRIASPCTARWEEMKGDEQVRFCNLCQKNVYNLSVLSSADAATLVKSKEGKLCTRFYQRADGTVLTDDCPIGLAKAWKRAQATLLAGIGLIVFTIINIAAANREEDTSQSGTGLKARIEQAKNDIKAGLGMKTPRLLMGEVSVSPVMGKVVAPHTPKSPAPKSDKK